MANEWLRLWHDMPNDPKFKTIARLSKQPISLVLSTYMHMLVDASRNVTRGHTDVTVEDLASALDVTEDQISAIFDAMEGRLKAGNQLSGWDKRQPKKEDKGSDSTGAKSATERKREQREREKSNDVTQSHDKSRNVTLDKDKEEIKIKSKTTTAPQAASQSAGAKSPKFDFAGELELLGADSKVVRAWMAVRKTKRATNTDLALEGFVREAGKAGLSVRDAVLICVERSWSGLDADWLKPKSQASPKATPMGGNGNSQLGVHGQATANAAKQWLEGSNAG